MVFSMQARTQHSMARVQCTHVHACAHRQHAHAPTQATPKVALTPEETEALTKRTQDGGTEVVQAKAGKVCVDKSSGKEASVRKAPLLSVGFVLVLCEGVRAACRRHCCLHAHAYRPQPPAPLPAACTSCPVCSHPNSCGLVPLSAPCRALPLSPWPMLLPCSRTLCCVASMVGGASPPSSPPSCTKRPTRFQKDV